MSVKRYLITSAQACYQVNKDGDALPYGGGRAKAVPHKELLDGFERYAKDTGAELIIMPIAGKRITENVLHESLQNRPDLFKDPVLELNKNIQIRNLVVPPQNVDPACGKDKLISKYNSSIIFPHSKQRYKPVAIFNADLPRYLYTTGAITLPNYNVANHRGDTAMRSHTFGGLVVEIIDDIHYNVRNIRALKNGKFIDLRTEYNGTEKPKNASVDALVIGDSHWGDHDEKTVKANYEMIDFFKPKRIFLHDFFNGHSINHHEKDNLLLRAREFKRGRLSLEAELEADHKELCRLSKHAGKNCEIYLVASNHHAFLSRYINGGDWQKEVWNAEIGSYLFNQSVCQTRAEEEIDESAYLLEEGLKRFGPLPQNFNFLRYRDNFRLRRFQLASHGDKGRSGNRGGNAISRAVTGGGKSITGHSHSMEVYGDTYIVGTSSKLDLPYVLGGGSAWIAANAVLYNNGTVQMLPIIEGKWKAKN